ncbi:MAG: xanthine dehydrogenase family protein subunit M [Kiritimatiellia bacterium]
MKTLEKTDCLFPATLNEALALLADESTRGRLLAGGSDLMVQWGSGVVPPPKRIISVKGLKELQKIREEDDRVVIGSGAAHAQIRRSRPVQKYLPALAAAAATVGGPQIQALGTIGGNVANASPAGDLAPALLVTGGDVVVAGKSGERTVPLAKFFLGYRKIDLKPDEMIVRFELPKMQSGETEAFRKLGTRAAQAISKVMCAARFSMKAGKFKTCAVAIGSVGPTTVRLPKLEKWIIGKPVNQDTLAEVEKRVSDEVSPIDDIRSTADYRKWVSGRLVRSLFES